MDAVREVKANAMKAQGEQNHSSWEVVEKCDQTERFHVDSDRPRKGKEASGLMEQCRQRPRNTQRPIAQVCPEISRTSGRAGGMPGVLGQAELSK